MKHKSPKFFLHLDDFQLTVKLLPFMVDGMKGYHHFHQCSLDKKSQPLTTFITFGHYKYLQVPYGLLLIAKHYNYVRTYICMYLTLQ